MDKKTHLILYFLDKYFLYRFHCIEEEKVTQISTKQKA